MAKKSKKYKPQAKPIQVKGVGSRGKHPFIVFNPHDASDRRHHFKESYITTAKQVRETALVKKAQKHGIAEEVIFEVYERGIRDYFENKIYESHDFTQDQWAFARVNSFLAGGRARKLDEDLLVEKAKKKEQPKPVFPDAGVQKNHQRSIDALNKILKKDKK